VTFTKGIALHDKITIDGTDMSNAFHTFGMTSEDTEVDVSGFSVSGSNESLAGNRNESFAGDVYHTTETYALLYPLHETREIFAVAWQPDGLIDSNREIFHALCQLRTYSPSATRGDPYTFTCTFAVADDSGITTS